MDTDEALAVKVQSGDSIAYGELMKRYESKLTRYASKFLLSSDDAQDLIQDVFIKAYENINSFDVSRKFSPWIYRIAHNEFINELNKRKSRKTVFTIDFDTFFPNLRANETSDKDSIDRELKEQLLKHVDALDTKYREVVVLYYIEGMEYSDISDILHIPVATVGVRLNRARALLQKNASKLPI